jgi:indole-3-glycerol phosphate synthase
LPNNYVSRRSTEAQADSDWLPPRGTLGDLTNAAVVRADLLMSRAEELRRSADSGPAVPSLSSALSGKTLGIIAEVKRASPSRGTINANLTATDQARAYERGGAVAISVLTEPTRFGGSNEDLVAVRDAVKLPVLKKDFHVAVIQLVEARALGASAALVIARAIRPDRLAEMLTAGRDIGLELLVEVRDPAELDLALSLEAELIGVNSRDLETLVVDRSTAGRVIPLIPRSLRAIAESGIETRADVEQAGAVGADAVLVGAALSASSDPEAAVRALVGVSRSVDAREG